MYGILDEQKGFADTTNYFIFGPLGYEANLSSNTLPLEQFWETLIVRCCMSWYLNWVQQLICSLSDSVGATVGGFA